MPSPSGEQIKAATAIWALTLVALIFLFISVPRGALIGEGFKSVLGNDLDPIEINIDQANNQIDAAKADIGADQLSIAATDQPRVPVPLIPQDSQPPQDLNQLQAPSESAIATPILGLIQTCTSEICDGKDNNCNGHVDEPSSNICPNGEFCIGGTCSSPPKIPSLYSPSTTGDFANEIQIGPKSAIQTMPNFNGYIIKLSDEPILAFKSRKQAESRSPDSIDLKREIKNYRAILVQRQTAHENLIKIAVPGAKIKSRFLNSFNGFSVEMTSQEADKIQRQVPNLRIYPNFEVRATLMDAIPLINADEVWNLPTNPKITGKGIRIAIIDTGVDYAQPDLGGCFGTGCKVAGGWDFVNSDPDPMDDHGHGTHVAATAAGKGVLNGVAKDATIYAYKVLDSGGSGYSDWIIAGIERATDPNGDGDFNDHLDVISMSLGGRGDPDDPMSQAVDNAVELGVVAVIAAGNSGSYQNSIGSPGTSRGAITVAASFNKNYDNFNWSCIPGTYSSCGTCPEEGSISCNYWGEDNPRVDTITPFSSWGPVRWAGGAIMKPDITAPGAMICAARHDGIFPSGEHPYYQPCLDQQHVQMAGTSMATPIVSGAVALLKQAHPTWTPTEIKLALRNTAVNIADESAIAQGYGRIDILEAVNLLNAPTIAEIESAGVPDGQIIGTAVGTNFASYIVSISSDPLGVSSDHTTWYQICTAANPISHSNLCPSFDQSSFSDGEYQLKLEVFASDGHSSTDKALINIDNLAISSPVEAAQVKYGSNIEVTGSANLANMNRYTLEYSNVKFDSQYSWFNEIGTRTLIYQSSNRIINGHLALFDTNLLQKKDSYYNMVLTVFDNNNNFLGADAKIIYVENPDPVHSGWPIRIPSGGTPSSLNARDVIGDNKEELFLANDHKDRQFFGWTHDAKMLDGWPPATDIFSGGSPTIGDINNDGKHEIAIVEGGRLHVFNPAGSELFSYQTNNGGIFTSTMSDIDNDGKLEIIYGSDQPELRVFGGNGSFYPGYPLLLNEPAHPNGGLIPGQAIGDINNDGYTDAVFATNAKMLYAYSLHDKRLLWKTSLDNYPNIPVLGDIDCDGNLEVVMGTSTGNYYDGKIYVYKNDGLIMPGWPQAAYGVAPFWNYQSFSLGDVNNDCKLEIFLSGFWQSIRAWNFDGTELSGWPKWNLGDFIFTQPIIGDINNDDKPDIVTQGSYRNSKMDPNDGGANFIIAWNADGTTIDGFPKQIIPRTCTMFYSTPMLGDFDKDGKLELAAHSSSDNRCDEFWGNATVTMWDLDSSINPSKLEWPGYMHDSRHTGSYPNLRNTYSTYDGYVAIGNTYMENTASNELLVGQNTVDNVVWNLNSFVNFDLRGKKAGEAKATLNIYRNAPIVSNCTRHGDGNYEAIGINCIIYSNSGYGVWLKDISAFAPIRAQIDILNGDGSLAKRAYLGEGESTIISEAENLKVQVNRLFPGEFAQQGVADLTIVSGAANLQTIQVYKVPYQVGGTFVRDPATLTKPDTVNLGSKALVAGCNAIDVTGFLTDNQVNGFILKHPGISPTTGASFSSSESTTNKPFLRFEYSTVSDCLDSDSGVATVAGTCTDSSGSFTDICIGTSINEAYCPHGSAYACSYQTSSCQFGCSFGKCNSGPTPTPRPKCTYDKKSGRWLPLGCKLGGIT